MGHTGKREALAQRLVDPAAITNDQRAQLGAFRFVQVGVDKCADMVPDHLNLGGWKNLPMADDHDRCALMFAGFGVKLRHDSLPQRPSAIVELAGVAVVAWKAQCTGNADLIANEELRSSHDGHARRAMY